MHDAVDAAPDEAVIADEPALRTYYREPHPAVRDKARPKIDPKAAAFVATSSLAVLATTSSSGTDASPRGGPPGFITVLDEHRIAFADLSGNNRLDSYTNVLEDPRVGLLLFVPGVIETLRINGRASLSTDPDVLARTAIDGVTPKVAVVVEVDECYVHCGKALRRSGAWDPSTWLTPEQVTSAAEVIVDQFQLPVEPAQIEADLEVGYQATMWVAGGDRDDADA